jgi:ABC-type molybdate transport system substrate-binding protein
MVILLHGNNNNPGECKAFVDFVLSEKGRKILEHCGFTGVKKGQEP